MVKDVVNNLMLRMLDEGIDFDVVVVGLTNGRRSRKFGRPRMKPFGKTSTS
jgi:hypothetical protein